MLLRITLPPLEHNLRQMLELVPVNQIVQPQVLNLLAPTLRAMGLAKSSHSQAPLLHLNQPILHSVITSRTCSAIPPSHQHLSELVEVQLLLGLQDLMPEVALQVS